MPFLVQVSVAVVQLDGSVVEVKEHVGSGSGSGSGSASLPPLLPLLISRTGRT